MRYILFQLCFVRHTNRLKFHITHSRPLFKKLEIDKIFLLFYPSFSLIRSIFHHKLIDQDRDIIDHTDNKQDADHDRHS